MRKEEIREILNNLNSEEEIINFVKERLSTLEETQEEKTLGQNYTDSFRDYISNKSHFKTMPNLASGKCADLVYDDITPYIELIKNLKEEDGLKNNLIALTDIYYTINEYLPSNQNKIQAIESRENLYGWQDRVSIKEIKEKQCGECAERAGLAQNMFKFLGMDSELVCGYINNDETHAYNLFYPKGYDNGPVLLYDTSQQLVFKNAIDERITLPMFKVLTEEEYKSLLRGESIKLDLTKSEEDCNKIYSEIQNGYKLFSEDPTYTFGLNNDYTNSIER